MKTKKKSNLLFIFIIASISIPLIKFNYINLKCTDISYCVKYNLTNSTLMRVNNTNIIFLDTDSAVVKAYGISKKAPHKTLYLKCHLKKNSFNSWKVTNIYYTN